MRKSLKQIKNSELQELFRDSKPILIKKYLRLLESGSVEQRAEFRKQYTPYAQAMHEIYNLTMSQLALYVFDELIGGCGVEHADSKKYGIISYSNSGDFYTTTIFYLPSHNFKFKIYGGGKFFVGELADIFEKEL